MVAPDFDNKNAHIKDVTDLTPTGSPSTFVHEITKSKGMIALEDGSRFADSAWALNTSDTSITVAVVATLEANSDLGYIVHGGGVRLNFECLVQVNGTIQFTLAGESGGTGLDRHETTAAFDDGIERLYLFHFEDDAVSLHAGIMVANSMALIANTQTLDTFVGWTGLATITLNSSPSGSFPAELNSRYSDWTYWNNKDGPSVSDANSILASILSLGGMSQRKSILLGLL